MDSVILLYLLFPFIGKPTYSFSFGLQHLILHSTNYRGYGFCFVYGLQRSSSYFHKYMVSLLQPAMSNELCFFLAISVHFSLFFLHHQQFSLKAVYSLWNHEKLRKCSAGWLVPSGNTTWMSKEPQSRNYSYFHKTEDLNTVCGMYYCSAARQHKEQSFIFLPETRQPLGVHVQHQKSKHFHSINTKWEASSWMKQAKRKWFGDRAVQCFNCKKNWKRKPEMDWWWNSLTNTMV